MKNVLRIVAGLFGAFFLISGLQWIIAPASIAEQLGMPLLRASFFFLVRDAARVRARTLALGFGFAARRERGADAARRAPWREERRVRDRG